MSDRDTLIGMGFSPERVDQALKVTGNGGLQVALDWLLAHADEPAESAEPSSSKSPPPDEETGELKEGEMSAQSLVCNDCGRRFRDATWAERHATLSGHVNFSESTEAIRELTPEEKAAKIQEIKERMKAKRAMLQEQEAKEQRERERLRRKAGQDLTAAREKLKEKEMQKALEERKREKEEERRARERVRRQIEEDKKERAARRAQLQEQNKAAAEAQAAIEAKIAAAAATKTYTETRLQLRVPNAAPIIETFPADATLDKVIACIRERTGAYAPTIELSTTFPRRVMKASDESKTLKELDLVPSAVLVVRLL